MTEEYGPDIRYGLVFAGGIYHGGLSRNNFNNQKPETQAYVAAWYEGCPIPGAVISRRGIPDTITGYLNVLGTRWQILGIARIHNPSLYQKMITNIKRLDGEPAGLHEPTSVPESYLHYIPATDTTCGYSLPRGILAISGGDIRKVWEKIPHNVELIRPVIIDADRPLLLVALAAEELIRHYSSEAETDLILRQAFSRSHLQEQNNITTFQELFGLFEAHAPTLFRRYGKLSSSERAEKGIAEIR